MRPVKFGISKSTTRHATPFRSKSNRRDPVRPKDPQPPEFPKPKLAFNRRIFQNVSKNIQNCSRSVPRPEQKSFMINLEDLLLMEKDLVYLVDSLTTSQECLLVCEEWWEITGENTLNNIEGLYRDEELKLNMKQCLVLGNILMGVIHYLICQGYMIPELISFIKNIVFNYHQGFLQFIKFVLSRVPQSTDNAWTQRLSELVKLKRANKN